MPRPSVDHVHPPYLVNGGRRAAPASLTGEGVTLGLLSLVAAEVGHIATHLGATPSALSVTVSSHEPSGLLF